MLPNLSWTRPPKNPQPRFFPSTASNSSVGFPGPWLCNHSGLGNPVLIVPAAATRHFPATDPLRPPMLPDHRFRSFGQILYQPHNHRIRSEATIVSYSGSGFQFSTTPVPFISPVRCPPHYHSKASGGNSSMPNRICVCWQRAVRILPKRPVKAKEIKDQVGHLSDLCSGVRGVREESRRGWLPFTLAQSGRLSRL